MSKIVAAYIRVSTIDEGMRMLSDLQREVKSLSSMDTHDAVADAEYNAEPEAKSEESEAQVRSVLSCSGVVNRCEELTDLAIGVVNRCVERFQHSRRRDFLKHIHESLESEASNSPVLADGTISPLSLLSLMVCGDIVGNWGEERWQSKWQDYSGHLVFKLVNYPGESVDMAEHWQVIRSIILKRATECSMNSNFHFMQHATEQATVVMERCARLYAKDPHTSFRNYLSSSLFNNLRRVGESRPKKDEDGELYKTISANADASGGLGLIETFTARPDRYSDSAEVKERLEDIRVMCVLLCDPRAIDALSGNTSELSNVRPLPAS